jgi:two-component system chemotaxis sensor kinase CheA
MVQDEDVREFLIESNENLANLDRQLVELEERPEDATLIADVFRTVHTIKGTSGFFGFDKLGAITHVAENILSQLRERQQELTPDMASLILESVDAVKVILAN